MIDRFSLQRCQKKYLWGNDTFQEFVSNDLNNSNAHAETRKKRIYLTP